MKERKLLLVQGSKSPHCTYTQSYAVVGLPRLLITMYKITLEELHATGHIRTANRLFAIWFRIHALHMRQRYHQSTLYFRPCRKDIYNSTRDGIIAKCFESGTASAQGSTIPRVRPVKSELSVVRSTIVKKSSSLLNYQSGFPSSIASCFSAICQSGTPDAIILYISRSTLDAMHSPSQANPELFKYFYYPTSLYNYTLLIASMPVTELNGIRELLRSTFFLRNMLRYVPITPKSWLIFCTVSRYSPRSPIVSIKIPRLSKKAYPSSHCSFPSPCCLRPHSRQNHHLPSMTVHSPLLPLEILLSHTLRYRDCLPKAQSLRLGNTSSVQNRGRADRLALAVRSLDARDSRWEFGL